MLDRRKGTGLSRREDIKKQGRGGGGGEIKREKDGEIQIKIQRKI